MSKATKTTAKTTAAKNNSSENLNTGLKENDSKKVAAKLNQLLADEFVLYSKTLKFHWNIEGPDFHALHIFLEEQYNSLQVIIDSIAERVRKIGHFAIGSMTEYLKVTTLKEHTETGSITVKEVAELVNDHESIIRDMRDCIDDFEEKYNDAGSADFITGLLKSHEKMAWMLRATTKR